MLKNCVHNVRLKKAVLILLAVFVVMSAAFSGNNSPLIYGAESDYDDEIESLEDELDDAQDAADELEEDIAQAEDDAQELEDEIDSLNTQLSSLSDEIEELAAQIADKEDEIAAIEADIAAKEAEIAAAEDEIAENEQAAQEQYESLLAWIQVSYENNFDSMFMSVMAAETFSEVLTAAEYVQSLSDFGIDLIERYNNTITTLEEEKAALEEQKAALEETYASLTESLAALDTLEEETAAKKSQVSLLITETQDTLDDLSDTIDSLEEQLAAQLAYEEEIEEAKAKAEAAKAAEIAAQEAALASSSSGTVVSSDESDLTLLAAIVYCEAGGESYEGQVAVACVVINRVRSSSFPNTISGVIYQSGQFSPVASGRLATVLANGLTTQSCYNAASYVLEGNLPYPSYLYFCSASIDLGISTTIIGNHQFY